MVAADVYRPAAVDQLQTLGRKLDVPVHSIPGMMPVELTKTALAKARSSEVDVVIIDTAGRLAIDDTLMTELERVKAEANPNNILFVCDAMIGQDAVRTAAEFNRRLSFSGFVLTKLDGDARGGARWQSRRSQEAHQVPGYGRGPRQARGLRPEDSPTGSWASVMSSVSCPTSRRSSTRTRRRKMRRRCCAESSRSTTS